MYDTMIVKEKELTNTTKRNGVTNMIIEFNESLMTGNEMIDTQHKELIDRICQLLSSFEQANDTEQTLEMLDYLMDYTEFHFGAEEQLQEEIHYPDLESHKQKHEEFKSTIRSLKQALEVEQVSASELVPQVKEQVADWFIRHIQGFDRSVAEYKFMTSNPNLL